MSGSDITMMITTVLAAALFGGCLGSMAVGFGHSTKEMAVGSIIGALLLGGIVAGTIAHAASLDREERQARLAEEIDANEYHVVSLWRRSDCQLDALAARSLADGRISRGEYDHMEGMAERLRKEDARADAGGSSPTRTCSVIAKE